MKSAIFLVIVLLSAWLSVCAAETTFEAPDEVIDEGQKLLVRATRGPVTGRVVYRSARSGQIEKNFQYRDGFRDGESIIFDDSGTVTLRMSWSAGKPNGPAIEYYANGNPKVAQNFTDGILDGEYIEWHESGVRKIEGRQVSNVKHGIWRAFSEKGELIELVTFDHGILKSFVVWAGDIEAAHDRKQAEMKTGGPNNGVR